MRRGRVGDIIQSENALYLTLKKNLKMFFEWWRWHLSDPLCSVYRRQVPQAALGMYVAKGITVNVRIPICSPETKYEKLDDTKLDQYKLKTNITPGIQL